MGVEILPTVFGEYMSTANSPFVGQTGGGSDFFSRLVDIISGVGGVVRNVGDVVRNPPPIWNTPGGNPVPPTIDDPTFRDRGNGGVTTATESAFSKYLPFMLIGGGLLLAVVVLKD